MTTRRQKPRSPTFLWQGLMLLLPVVMLVVVHFKVLRFDRVLAETQAQQESRGLAEELVDRLWQALTEPNATHVAYPRFVLNEKRSLINPVPYPERPDPVPLDLSDLSPLQADLWRQLELAGGDGSVSAESSLRDLQEFLGRSPPARFVELARYRLGSVLARRGQVKAALELFNQVGRDDLHVLGETGLPLFPLAQIRALELQDRTTNVQLNAAGLGTVAPQAQASGWREPDVRHVFEQILAHPSALTPWLIDRLAQAMPADSLTNVIAEFRHQWRLQETSRRLHRCSEPVLRIEEPVAPLLTVGSISAPVTPVSPARMPRGQRRLFWLECPVPEATPEWLDPLGFTSMDRTKIPSDGLDPDRALAYSAWRLLMELPERESGAEPATPAPHPPLAGCDTWLVLVRDQEQSQSEVICYPSFRSHGNALPLTSWPAPVLTEVARFAKRLPPYLGLSLEVAGRTLLSSNQLPLLVQSGLGKGGGQGLVPYEGPKAAPPQVLGSARKGDTAGEYLQANIHLLSPSLIYSRQRERSRWFSALVAAASLVAALGFISARRAFLRRQRLAELQTNFVSSVSHELRAPIASVRLMAEGLDRGTASTPEKQREYFGLIVRECRRLSAMIENVLDFARIEQNRKEYEREPTDLARLVTETLQLMEPVAAENQVRLQWQQPSGDLPQPSLDGRAIQQALVNLLDNAIKHSPPGATVEVVLQLEPGVVRLSVLDHGPGIPPSEQEKIFDRFYRLGSELRRETQGVGIGLSIVKHIAEGHRGRVSVQSTLGQGSRFLLELPLDTSSPDETAHTYH